MGPTVSVRIDSIDRMASERDYRELAELLVDAINSGSGLSFLAPLSIETAEAFWRRTLEQSPPRACILVARDESGIVGTVQLQPAWPPNQPHRGDVAKLIVHRRARRRGIGRALMEALEARAAAAGFTLLLLDTVRGHAAERLYAAMGWQRVGVVPNFALNPDGETYCDTVFFYKALA
jgi:GNAT superfamily N-acetyltransferase